jgi:uridine kinase
MDKPAEEEDLPELKMAARRDTAEVKKILIGVSGGSASGKSYFCNKITTEILYDGRFNVLVISMDDFYKSLGHGVDPGFYNFDNPSAIDFDEAYKVLLDLINGVKVEIPM